VTFASSESVTVREWRAVVKEACTLPDSYLDAVDDLTPGNKRNQELPNLTDVELLQIFKEILSRLKRSALYSL